MRNPCARTVAPENAYEVYASPDGKWIYYVLKKYKSETEEAKDRYARWHVLTVTPITSKDGERGDAYVTSIKDGMNHLIDNPLCSYLCVYQAEVKDLAEIGLGKYRCVPMETFDPKLTNYLRIQVPKKDVNKVNRILQEHELRIICTNANDFIDHCLTNVQVTEQGDT